MSLGRERSRGLGRRGLAGNVYGQCTTPSPVVSGPNEQTVLKVVGAAAQEGWSFERCVELATEMNANLVTVGTSLDHCHIPGRAHHEQVAEDACVLGMGIHNEPGLITLSPMPSPEDIVSKMLKFLLDPTDTDRAFVEFREGDEVSMLINNFGGLSVFETEALADVTLHLLEKDYKIRPIRNFVGPFETSLNGPGFSISLANISGLARSIEANTEEIMRLLDAPTDAASWPKNGYAITPATDIPNGHANEHTNGHKEDIAAESGPQVDPQSIDKVLRKACNAAILAEPEITRMDIVMGDGDCGEAVEGACRAILGQLDAKNITRSSSFLQQMDVIIDTVEDIGGSLFAIIAILLTAFANSIRQQRNDGTLTVGNVAEAVGPAIEGLKKYTSARVGGRTVMDTLIPFCETLQQTSNLEKAVQAAEEGAKDTAVMKAKFGRATYVGDKGADQETPMDPGAYALAVFLRSLADGVQSV